MATCTRAVSAVMTALQSATMSSGAGRSVYPAVTFCRCTPADAELYRGVPPHRAVQGVYCL